MSMLARVIDSEAASTPRRQWIEHLEMGLRHCVAPR
jgi:hypothetical protein